MANYQFTRDRFNTFLLAMLGYPGDAPQWLKDWLSGWSSHEIGVGGHYPVYNLFGCGFAWPGATTFNDHGVKNYPSFGAGIAAMAVNLRNGLYTPLVTALVAGDRQALTTSQGVKQSLHNWRAGPNSKDWNGYENNIANFIADGTAHRADTFTGPDSGSGGGVGPQAVPQSKPCDPDQNPNGLSQKCKDCLLAHKLDPGGPTACFSDMQGSGADTINKVVGSGLSGLLPDWLQHPDWVRFAKWVVGILLIIVALVLGVIVVSNKAANSPLGEKITSIGKEAAVAA